MGLLIVQNETMETTRRYDARRTIPCGCGSTVAAVVREDGEFTAYCDHCAGVGDFPPPAPGEKHWHRNEYFAVQAIGGHP